MLNKLFYQSISRQQTIDCRCSQLSTTAEKLRLPCLFYFNEKMEYKKINVLSLFYNSFIFPFLMPTSFIFRLAFFESNSKFLIKRFRINYFQYG